MAFYPTPALDHNEHSFLSFSGSHRHTSTDHGWNSDVREVRFDDHPEHIPIHGRHSIATSNVPLLPSVSSASHITRQSFRIANPPYNVDMNAYFENCRNINEQLRQTHEQERRAWDIERSALRTRIADLELKLNKVKDGGRRLSNESSHGTFRSLPKLDFDSHKSVAKLNARHAHVQQAHTAPSQPPVWQPESPVPPTRVFGKDDDITHLPSISEDAPLEDMDELSPRSTHENHSIPIQQIDGTLDGITVKSEGVRSSFSKIMSPIVVATPARSPSPRLYHDGNRLTIERYSALDGLEHKLVRNAGHTPMLFDGTVSATDTLSALPTPKPDKLEFEQTEDPIAPAPTAKRPPPRPSEKADSFFTPHDVQATAEQVQPVEEKDEIEPKVLFDTHEDKPLTGPLMLDHLGQSQASHVFLDKLDEKLNEEVRKSKSNSPENIGSPARQRSDLTGEDQEEEEEVPRLRLKQSTNFGSAYGFSMPGQKT